MSNNIEIVKNLEPKSVFEYFARISDIPRGSGNTDKIVEYLVNFAIDNNLKYKKDDYNNVIIIKESKNKTKTSIALQAHIDMVCVKNDQSKKDMKKEGIDFVLDGDFLRANGTTLGADDGIGVAIILSILSDINDYERDIIGIFTDDEEVGLVGANNIDLSGLDIKNLINIDNEEFGVFDVGCAGGTHLEYSKKATLTSCENAKLLNLSIEGLLGGHSGMEITKKRGNANKIIAQVLNELYEKISFNLISVDGGVFDNAIPNKANAKIAINSDIDDVVVISHLNQIKAKYVDRLKENEPNINMRYDFGSGETVSNVFGTKDTKEIIDALCLLPDGLISVFENNPLIAETSLNLGIVNTNDKTISFTYLIRSNVDSKREELVDKIYKISTNYGFTKKVESSYPAWEYRKTSLEEFCISSFKDLFGSDAVIEITHGGLECGILLKKMKDTEAIALGPTIYGAHTVDEKLEISTVIKTYKYILKVLENLI